MCGIVGFVDKLGRRDFPAGRVVLSMLDALTCRGPDSAGVALLREAERGGGIWSVRIAPFDKAAASLDALDGLGHVERVERQAASLRLEFRPHPGGTN